MKPDIIIPTCKIDISALLNELKSLNAHIIVSSNPSFSAAQNRNLGLNRSTSDYIIMLDDDVSNFQANFTPCWHLELIHPLIDDPKISIVSARLMKADNKTPAPMMSNNYDLTTPLIEVKKVPTACIAFRKTNIRFDENFLGSGFEDDDFCRQMGPKIVINNLVKAIHKNEMKRQETFWEQNRAYFIKKWGNYD